MTKLLTNRARLHSAEELKESITEASNTAYYLFMGNHVDYANGIPDIEQTVRTNFIDVYQNMIMGKRITSSDVSLMIRNIPYVSNTIYDEYDDQEDLSTKDYFVIVDEGSYFHIYKCLHNNGNTRSTVEPSFAHITGSNTTAYMTSDGYTWKYMTSVPSADKLKFSTELYFPVVANTNVQLNASEGSIDVIKVEGAGLGYDNYLTGTFDAASIKVGGNSIVYSLSSNALASSVNGFYTDCLLYLSEGTGAGQYKHVTNYYSNSTGRYAVVNSAFTTNPTNGTQWQIYPNVKIIGSGSQTVNAVARAIVNANSSNSIHRVEILERGRLYNYSTATVQANAVVGVESVAELRPIYSPFKGHGYNVFNELGANSLAISVKVSNTESNTLLVTNQFQQIGLIKDPLFVNVGFSIINVEGVFINNEPLYTITPVRINESATMNTTSTTVSCNTADFENQVDAEEILYFKTASGLHYLGVVNSITNSSTLELTANGGFSCTNIDIYKPNFGSRANVTRLVNGSFIEVSNTPGIFSTGDTVIGNTSYTVAVINTISRNDVAKDFNTFIQMYKYDVSIDSGVFEENELVYQSNTSTANALLHSVINSNVMYTTKQIGQFVTNSTVNTVIGQTSGAVATISGKYYPELQFGGGEILYLENIEAVSRSANTSETFRIIFNF